ncbi:MAG: hypothetical protein IJ593_00915 [Lachnospiraceae bacterium]|nr:hypothetical protein [Lachnospiraceae bacterium]
MGSKVETLLNITVEKIYDDVVVTASVSNLQDGAHYNVTSYLPKYIHVNKDELKISSTFSESAKFSLGSINFDTLDRCIIIVKEKMHEKYMNCINAVLVKVASDIKQSISKIDAAIKNKDMSNAVNIKVNETKDGTVVTASIPNAQYDAYYIISECLPKYIRINKEAFKINSAFRKSVKLRDTGVSLDKCVNILRDNMIGQYIKALNDAESKFKIDTMDIIGVAEIVRNK